MDSKLKLGISFAIIIAVIISSNHNFYWSLLLGQDNSTTEYTSQTVNAKADALKIGYFPNLNHAQAIIGLNNGDFRQIIENDKNLGNISLKGIVFTSGPSAIELYMQVRLMSPTLVLTLLLMVTLFREERVYE